MKAHQGEEGLLEFHDERKGRAGLTKEWATALEIMGSAAAAAGL